MELSGETELLCAPTQLRALLLDGPGLARRLAPEVHLRLRGDGAYEGEIALATVPFARRHPVRVHVAEEDGAVRLDMRGQGRSQGLAIEVRLWVSATVPEGRTRLRYRVRTELGGLREALGKGGLQRRIGELLTALRAELPCLPAETANP